MSGRAIAAEAARAPARAPLDLSRIGGSDVAAILGVSDYSTRFDVWLRLVYGFSGEPTDAMRNGLRFERAIGEWWSEKAGVELEWFDSFRHPSRDWQRLSPDVRVRNTGEIADIKRSRRALDRHGAPGTDEIAEYELVQMQTYLEGLHSMGEGAELGHLVVHDLEHDDLYTWVTRRDPEFGALIVEECERFWLDHVVTKKPPEMSGSETAKAWLEKRKPRDTKPARPASPDELKLVLEYRDVYLGIKQLESREDVLKNQLREAIGEHRGLRGPFGSISYAAIDAASGPDYLAVARDLAKQLVFEQLKGTELEINPLELEERLLVQIADRHQRVSRQSHRRLAPSWKKEKCE